MDIKKSVAKHVTWLQELSEDAPYTVFLCGPSLENQVATISAGITGKIKSIFGRRKKTSASAQLRQRLLNDLIGEGFDVVLGEDDGLEEGRIRVGLNAQDNELEFISRQCNAVIVIADSVGAFCELGLFSWHFVHKDGRIGDENKPAFIVIINKEYQDHKSYFNEGPVGSIHGFGYVYYVDYESYDLADITKMLSNRRIIETLDKRGRPKGHKK
jgi:hypothetical protein